MSATGASALDPADWSMQYDADHWFPFVEDENANITGLGHQDPSEFVAAVNAYDQLCDPDLTDDDLWDADYISHQWAVLSEDGERLYTRRGYLPVTEHTEGAIAITTLWGQR